MTGNARRTTAGRNGGIDCAPHLSIDPTTRLLAEGTRRKGPWRAIAARENEAHFDNEIQNGHNACGRAVEIKAQQSQEPEADCHELRCMCRNLIARRRGRMIELKCRRCKRILRLELTERGVRVADLP
ncbi:MAG TPA: hypothetical protein VEL28_01515 [Candidatus Binatia bacterium]|nr:hypothetical protein [Candidatus Binatia bacterium]